jgi:8-oxo-dGTP pyrophosphatase MutT (NUDIX family)
MKFFTFEKSVGAVVFRETVTGEKEFLLLHYPSGHWDFPKGHVEKNETEEETLRREVVEETGIENLEIFSGFRNNIYYFYRAKDDERERREKNNRSINVCKKVIYHIAQTKAEDIKISFEHTGFEWLHYKDALDRITFENGKSILQKAHKFLEKNSIVAL